MRSKRMFAVAAVAATLSLAGTACAAPEDDNSGSGSAKTALTLGWNQPFYSYNELTSNGNNVSNSNTKYLTTSQFWYVTADGETKPDTSFGTYEKTSDDPLTVKYTVADDAKWSDGTPVDAADLLLDWASQSGNLNTIDSAKVKTDEATGLPKNTKGKVYFDTSSYGLSLVKDTPEISEDGKSFTMVYTKPFADWLYDITVSLPAHVVAEKALGIADPTEAKAAFIKAVQDKDQAKLVKISEFWNTGFDYTSMPKDTDLALSSGAYVIKDLKENEYMTFAKNPEYKGDHAGVYDTLTVRWNEDPMAQVQAVKNGEIDMISPQVTTDVVKAAEKIKDVDIKTGTEASFEHLDLTFNNKGPFDPASYGGDAAKALAVRKAFLTGVPRQEIVDKLIKPINPEAEVRNAITKTSGTPGYDEVVAQNGSSEYAETDPAAAKAMLKKVGITKPVDVRMMYAKDNVRRVNEFEIMKPALAEAGFNVIDAGTPKWSEKLADGTYDAVFFAWSSPTPAISQERENYATGTINNMSGYSNKTVDSKFEELLVTTDETEQVTLLADIEKELFADGFGLPIFEFPSANISNKKRIDNVNPGTYLPVMFYGYWDWKVPARQ